MASDSTVRDYVTLQRGLTYKGNLVGKPGPALLGLGSITPGGGFRVGDYKTYGGECLPKHMLFSGDLFVSLKGATKDGEMIGSVARVPLSVPTGRLTQDTVGLRFHERSAEISSYIYWILRTPQYRDYCRGHATGSAVVALSRDDFLNFPVPERTSVRTKIVEVLEEVEYKIELNRRMNATLEAMARALFQSWFVDFDPVRAKLDGRHPPHLDPATAALFPESFEESELGKIPKHWTVVPLSELAVSGQNGVAGGPFGSNLTRSDYVVHGIPVIRGNNMTGSIGWFRDSEFVYVTEAKGETLKTNMASAGDIVFTQRGTLGQIALIPFDARYRRYVISQSQMRLTCADGVPPEYVYLYFRQPSVIDYIIGNATSAGVPHINLSFLRQFRVLRPSRDILREFERCTRPWHQRITKNANECELLATLRDTLLPKLLSGEVRVPDAERFVEEAT